MNHKCCLLVGVIFDSVVVFKQSKGYNFCDCIRMNVRLMIQTPAKRIDSISAFGRQLTKPESVLFLVLKQPGTLNNNVGVQTKQTRNQTMTREYLYRFSIPNTKPIIALLTSTRHNKHNSL